jgi:hypothetical protein
MAPMQIHMKENIRMNKIRETMPKTEFDSDIVASAWTVTTMVLFLEEPRLRT